jgi:ferritin
LDDLATYYKKRAEEENLHHYWILEYLSNGDCRINYPEIPKNNEIPTSIIDPFIMTINREIETTQMIYKIYEQAEKENDYLTCVWLQKHLLPEQIEEENTSRAARVIMELDCDLLEKCEKVLDLLK